MNLRKKKASFNYQDSQFLSKHYQYEELTKGKRRQQVSATDQPKEEEELKPTADPPVTEQKDYNLIFAQLIDSIKKNMEQKRFEPGIEEAEEEEAEQIRKQPKSKKSNGLMKTELKKEVNSNKLKRRRYGGDARFQILNDLEKDPEGDQLEKKLETSFKSSNRSLYRTEKQERQAKSITLGPKITSIQTQSQTDRNKNIKTLEDLAESFKNSSAQTHPKSKNFANYYNCFSGHAVPSNSLSACQKTIQSETKNNNDIFAPRETKLFNRSSYHVGIAYYIHFKKNQYYKDPLQIDPTYHAKKMMQKLHHQKL